MPRSDTIRILFVHQPTLGLRHDAIVMAQALSRAIPQAEYHSFELPNGAEADMDRPLAVPGWLSALMPFHLVVFFEHMVPCAPLYDPRHCHRRVYVPNHEWITPNDEIALARFPLDAVLYKNRLTREIFEGLAGARDVPVRRLVGWTSLDIAEQPGDAPDFTKFIHVRGVSVQKQTDVVIEAWLANPDFPPLTVLARMRENFDVPVPMRAAPNLEIVLQRLEAPRLRALQRAHGVHVSPSLVEGFGHSLNEARACGAILVTTDGPPMADFVVPGTSGMLVPVDTGRICAIRRSRSHPVSPADLAHAVRAVMAMTDGERAAMGAAARAHYLRDRQAFETAIGEVFGAEGAMAPA